MSDKRFLDRVYDFAGSGDVKGLYDEWADSYDAELSEAGYATPGRVARAMRETGCVGPVLDIGCGTGLSGRALAGAGYEVIDGNDLSAPMLERARALGVYRRLWQCGPDPLEGVAPGDFPTIAAIGMISHGAAPAHVLDDALAALAPGGRLAVSFNQHTLDDPAYTGALDAALTDGRARRLFAEHGPHLAGEKLESTVYVLERA